MTWLHPAMLWGLLAAAVPVAIHLFSKPRQHPMRWAAMHLLVQSIQKNRRRLRGEDLLLLLLRCLVVAVLVMIFARPAPLVPPGAPPPVNELVTVVIVLDHSASMGRSDGLRTRFDDAKAAAVALVDGLAPGSSAAVLLASDRVKRLVARPTNDLASVRRALESTALTDAGSDLYPAIKAAVDLLKTQLGGRRELVVFTDAQATAWRELAQIRQLQAEVPGVAFQIRLLGERDESNVAISSVQLVGNVAVAKQPLRFAVEVKNWSAVAVDNIPVQLATDGDEAQDETLVDRLEPRASRVVTLSARFQTAGPHSVTAGIPADRLPFDNRRSLALTVSSQIQAFVVDGSKAELVETRDGFFLQHALVPTRRGLEEGYWIKAAAGTPSQLGSAAALAHQQVVLLANVARLTATEAKRLREFVEAGGALIVFPGPDSDVGFYNTQPDFSALLPAKLGAAQEPATAHKTLSWQSRGYEHPVTTLWNEPDSGDFSGVRVSRYFPLTLREIAADGSPATGVRVIMNYANGEPAIAEHAFGRGRVVLFSSSATTAWTTLPLHPSFVPLLARLVAHVSGQAGGGAPLLPGRPFVAPLDDAIGTQSIFVLRPGENVREPGGLIERSERAATVRYHDTEQAGVYSFFANESATQPLVVFSVQSDPAESNLTSAPADELAALNDVPAPSTPATAPEKLVSVDAGAARVPGDELWPKVALAALILAALETLLAHFASRVKA